MRNAIHAFSVLFLVAGGLAAPTAIGPETQQLTRLGEIEACWLTGNALYEHEGPCRFLWCELVET